MISLVFKGAFYCPELKKSFSRGRYTPQNEQELSVLLKYAEKTEELIKALEAMLTARQQAESGKPEETEEDETEPKDTTPITPVNEQAAQPAANPVPEKTESANKASAAESKKQDHEKGRK